MGLRMDWPSRCWGDWCILGSGFEVAPAFFALLNPLLPFCRCDNRGASAAVEPREAARQHPVDVRGVITCLVGWGRGRGLRTRRAGFSSTSTLSYRDRLLEGDFVEIRA